MDQIVIVGGGLVGSLVSLFLVRRGYEVKVYERSTDIRQRRGTAGRSINLVLTARGISALQRVGLDQGALKLTVPVLGRMMHSVRGELSYQPYGKDDSECNYSIPRKGLNEFLISAAEQAGVQFLFERKLVKANLPAGRLVFEGPDGSAESIEAAVVVGADGAGSRVRRELVKLEGFEESAELLGHDYKELEIPADLGARIERKALHIWPRGEIMLMALPNLDGSFTVTLYLPRTGPKGFESLTTERAVIDLFERQFADAIALIPDLAEQFLANPTGILGTVRCDPWHLGGRTLLIGDAAHAIVPFFGQGMNCGFEDCHVLETLMDRHGTADLATLFEAFSRSRKPNADAIADMALENFVEMSERVGDDRFLLRKAVEHRLEQELPLQYRSRYSMVMYSSIPYGLAQQAGRVQQQILDELCQGLEDAAALNLGQARALIEQKLTPFLQQHAISLDY